MSELAAVLTGCHACRSPFVESINKKMKEGLPDSRIADWLKEQGGYISRITLGRHKREHLIDSFEKKRKEAAKCYSASRRPLNLR